MTRIKDQETKKKYNSIKEKIQEKIENDNYIKYESDNDLLCSD